MPPSTFRLFLRKEIKNIKLDVMLQNSFLLSRKKAYGGLVEKERERKKNKIQLSRKIWQFDKSFQNSFCSVCITSEHENSWTYQHLRPTISTFSKSSKRFFSILNNRLKALYVMIWIYQMIAKAITSNIE